LAFCLFVPLATANETEDWEHRSWIAKAGRVLSGGTPLSHAEVEALAPLTRQEVVERLFARRDFGDSVLDFSLFYLGFKPTRLWRPSSSAAGARDYDFMVFAKPQAVAAAQAIVNGGEFLDLLSLQVPRYFQAFESPYLNNPPRDGMSDVEIRAALYERGMAAFDRIISGFRTADGGYDKNAGCAARSADAEGRAEIEDMFGDGGYGFVWQFEFLVYPDIDINIACGTQEATAEQVIALLEAQRRGLQALYGITPEFTRDAYVIRGIADVKAPANPDNLAQFAGDQFGFFGYWQHLPNSSTNFNRKRAAYMLKTYFCDDLTPLGVVPGDDQHPGDGHASDPGCQACHYKLDPMAGFFKDKGLLGVDFADKSFYVFDDNATIFGDQLASYRASWPTVGYIRSVRDPSVNDYGENLEDLYEILRRAPEVKQCLVRRMAEYYLGRDQVFDGGWLDHLTQRFSTNPSSTAAFKDVTAQLILSNTFRQDDPQPDQCYDHFPATPAPNAVPCAVAHVVRNNCAGCHRSTGPNVGGLDLSRWIEVGRDADNQPIMSFPHLDANGAQLPRATTFTRLAERLNTSDPALSMPKNRDMNAVDKARLYLWVQEQP
jgi:hypothetical protein